MKVVELSKQTAADKKNGGIHVSGEEEEVHTKTYFFSNTQFWPKR